ncbi:translocation/assembly module TamB domain-containing protein [Massilia endophytica]|uniref:translocation/assembly module TamB domain-containing protein n=1 Tax=Massilia endophytica TaxID=2899220 RepID=UPI001E3DCBF7|nr:translocation/assembly module TamB domain-containing protein [Massilia endophytica]UGQ46874.1 translocation/assembly module TamB domain-containing protein [Massilia endophytica]
MAEENDTPAPPPPVRRWPRRVAIGFGITALLLGGAVWLLGRETTLQQIVRQVERSSGGQITITGVHGSLYGRMHLDRLVFRSPDSVTTAENIDIDWSPLQYLSQGVAVSELHVASTVMQTLRKSPPPTMPASIAPPFRLSIADAKLTRLVMIDETGQRTQIDNTALKLYGDSRQWQVKDASASTPLGRITANATVGAKPPFRVDGTATLSQAAAAPGRPAAELTASASGSFELLAIAVKGKSSNATGDGVLTLAPFDPIILRTLDLRAHGVDPSRFNSTWPSASLELAARAEIGQGQRVSGSLSVVNTGATGPLDRQRIPLRAVNARLGGTLTVASIEDVMIDLGAAGSLAGSGSIHRSAPDGGIETADFRLHTSRIDLHEIHGSAKPTAIAGEIAASSQGKAQRFNARLADKGLRLDALATLEDSMLHVSQARLSAGRGVVAFTGQASLKDDKAFKAAASISHFDPSALGKYPAADLNADVRAGGRLAPELQASAEFTIRPSRFMDQALTGSGKLNADAKHLSGIDVKLAFGANTAQANGSFGLPGDRLSWRADAKNLAALGSGLRGALSAGGVATGGYAAPRSSFDATARGLSLGDAKARGEDSVLSMKGEVGLAGPQKNVELTASGSASRFNPAAFGAPQPGSIGAEFSVSGRLAEDWRGKLDVKLLPSTFSGAPLSGYARVAANSRHVESADVNLQLGQNTLQANGGFGAVNDRLDWKLDAPQLSNLGPGFGGVLRGSGTLSGTAGKPAIAFSMDGSNLRLMTDHQIRAIRASANLGAGQGAADAVVSDVDLTGYSSPTTSIERARLQTTGNRAAHTVQLSAVGKDFDAALRLRGGMTGDTWTGAIESLQNKGRFALALQAPAPLRLTGAAGKGVLGLARPVQLSLTNAALALSEGVLRIETLEKNGPRWRSRGAAAGVNASYLAQFSDAWRDNVVSDLTLAANWGIELTVPAVEGVAPAIDGSLSVFREKGDITVTGGEHPIPLGLSQLEARVNVAGDVLRVQTALNGSRSGQAKLEAAAHLENGRIPKNSPLAISGNVDIPSIAWLSPLAGVRGLELDGALRAAFSGNGTVGEPVLNGDVKGERLSVNWPEQALKLRNGRLAARVDGDRLQLQQLHFEGQQGVMEADGWMRLANAEAAMELKLVADKLEVLSSPDRILVLSGRSTLVRDAKHFQLDGKFRADRAAIELPSLDTPTISDDVVILGRTKPSVKSAAAAMPLNVDVEADLGDDFYLKGKGLDAQLAGAVQVRITDRRPPRVNGSIRVVSGTYAAYGQKLAIERGVINFTGAYDNPGLNIRAMRKRPEGEQLSDTNVEAGVEVRGTAQAPVAKLVSTPSVPDSEKLSWLVLGHGLSDMAGNEMGLLGTAAGALFGGKGGGSLANKVGLDELGVSQTKGLEGLEGTVVTVGKKLSSRAYLSFEQGAGTATSLVKLRYKLTPRITLQFQTGTNNALDVLYTWAFD